MKRNCQSRKLVASIAMLSAAVLPIAAWANDARVAEGPLKLAIYVGDGAKGAGVCRWLELLASAEGVETVPVDAAAVRRGALEGVDSLVVPGGEASLMAKALGAEGGEIIRSFVERGGGYIGTGAGCGLVMEPSAKRKGMLNMVPFAFGVGGGEDVADLLVHFNARAEALAGIGRGDMRIRFGGGAVMVPSLPVTNGEVEVVATYASNVNAMGGRKRPSMAGQAAAVAGTYGKGRIFATALQPECDVADHDVLRGAFIFATGRRISWNLPQRRRGQLAVGILCDDSPGVGRAQFLMRLVRSAEFDVVPITSANVADGVTRHLDVVLSQRDIADGEAAVRSLRELAASPILPPPPLPKKVAKPIRAAIYEDRGGSNLLTAQLLSLAPEYELTVLDAADYRAGALDGFDLVVQPGGWSSTQYENLGEKGREALVRYVTNGGRYYGICAGAFLAAQPCRRRNTCIGFVPFRDDSPEHYRGWAPMKVAFTDEGRELFGTSQTNRVVMYWGGPAFVAGNPIANANMKVFGTYAGRIVNTHSSRPVKPMVGKAAFVGGSVGRGKVFLACPHPEKSEANMDIVRGAIKYLTGVAPGIVEMRRARGAVTVFFRSGKEKAASQFYLDKLLRDRRFDVRVGSHLYADILPHLDVVIIHSSIKDEDDTPFVRKFIENGGRVVFVADTAEKMTCGGRIPGVIVVDSYDKVIDAIFRAR